MSCEHCAPDAATEELLALLDVIENETARRDEILRQQRSLIEREIHSNSDYAEFAATLRRQVEAGQKRPEAALVELVPRHFNSSEFISNLHEFKARRAS